MRINGTKLPTLENTNIKAKSKSHKFKLVQQQDTIIRGDQEEPHIYVTYFYFSLREKKKK